MNDRHIYRLVHDSARRLAAAQCALAPDGYIVTIEEPKKTRGQEEKYHAMITDISKVWVFMGQKLSRVDTKRILIDAFARIKAEEGKPLKGWGRILPSIDGTGFVQLGVQSRDFKKIEASEFVEYLYMFGTELNVYWSEYSQWSDQALEEFAA